MGDRKIGRGMRCNDVHENVVKKKLGITDSDEAGKLSVFGG
ncbi:hypothetical protein [Corynebacterium diphtheriae]|nr:hypothetical protein [Corynebacterium diphtheriae]